MKAIRICLSAFFTVVAFDAAAATIYKSTDEDGLITYSDEQPRASGGQITPLDIDTTGNTTQLPQPPQSSASPQAESENERIIRRRPAVKDESAVVLARYKLDAARAALDDAQNNSSADDWIFFDRRMHAPGSRGPTPEYLTRLDSLEAQVKAAEATLVDAERAFRLAP